MEAEGEESVGSRIYDVRLHLECLKNHLNHKLQCVDDDLRRAKNYYYAKRTNCTEVGLLVNPTSWWVGVQYSKHNKRWCINVIPCVTLCITLAGGIVPSQKGD